MLVDRTTTGKDGKIGVATITKGVEATKNTDGGLDVLLSPAVIAKLEAIHKDVKPCAARRRSRGLRKRGGPACGLADFVERVGADRELGESFSQPLNDQVWDQIDEGYASDDPEADPGWEGDGEIDPPGDDEGYFSDDDEGFFEGSEQGSAADTVEDIVIGTEEEAASLGQALGGADAAVNEAVYGGSTVTVGSFLAFLWKTLDSGAAFTTPTRFLRRAFTRSPRPKPPPLRLRRRAQQIHQGCVPTSARGQGAKPTDEVHWKCSKRKSKDCECNPKIVDHTSRYDAIFDQVILKALDELGKKPEDPVIDCPPPFGKVPSKWFVDDTAKNFCNDVMGNRKSRAGPTGYDIDGNKIPIRKQAKLPSDGRLRKRTTLTKRTPPVSKDDYKDFKFFLGYEPKDGGTNAGSVNDLLFPKSSIEVGCAKFSWTVINPPEPPKPAPKPKLQPRQCHNRHKMDHVHKKSVDLWSGTDCKDQTMKAGDKEIYWHPIGFLDLNSNYKISWIDGCTVTKEQNVMHPIEGSDANCQQLLKDNYYLCPIRSRSRSPYRTSRSHHSRSPYRSPRHDSHHSRHKRRHHEAATIPVLPFSARPLSKHDLKTYEPMLALYLDIQKNILLEDLSADEVKGRWKSFVGKWNRGDLAEGWYDPKTLDKALNQAPPPPPRTHPPQQPSSKTHKQSTESATALDSNPSPDSDSESLYGPSLPTLSSTHRSHGPTIPQTADLTLSREAAHTVSLAARASTQSSLKSARRTERAARTLTLDTIAPRPAAGTHARILENKALQRLSNTAFADRSTALENDDAADAESAMGGGDSFSELKSMKEREEKKRSEREVRREEALRARRAEREERMRGIREREERTMGGLRELARVRFGAGGEGGGG
ncbi:MAG: hypothetical protein Q9160_009137 [Pyrenula sp. 1 TL-2023]